MSKELELIRDFWSPVIKDIVDNLTSMKDSRGHNREGSGKLGQSIGLLNQNSVIETATDYMVTISAPYYAKFVDEGVKGYENKYKNTGKFSFKRSGKRIPISAIRSFMMARGIVPRGEDKERTKLTDPNKQLNAIAFLIGAAIKRSGIEQVPFYSSILTDALIDLFTNKMSDIMAQKMVNDLIKKL